MAINFLTIHNGLGSYEDYEMYKNIIHYLHWALEINIKLDRYKGGYSNRVLWNISMQEHEANINALHEREDAYGIID